MNEDVKNVGLLTMNGKIASGISCSALKWKFDNCYGLKRWSTTVQNLPGHIGKQCRERYDYRVV